MNTTSGLSAASCSRTLLEVCREQAADAEWLTYIAAANLGSEALRKEFADDFSECAPEASTVAYHDRPFADPHAAERYLAARNVARDLLGRAVAMMIDRHWKAEARRTGEAMPERIDMKLVLALGPAIDATTLEVEGVDYFGLTFRPPSADRFEELVQLIRDHEPRMDPRFDTIADFQQAIKTIVGRPVPTATFKEAMRAAPASPEWNRQGRRRGTTSNAK